MVETPGMYELQGKRVLITGASTGIGAGLAKGFATAGATVGICARRPELLEPVLAECRAHAPESRMWVIDLADLDAVSDWVLRADDELGGIDILVNNAGIPKRRKVTDLTPAIVESVMHINYASPIRITLALLPRMLERSHADRRGDARIINISSVAARISPPAEAAYSATKAALTAFSEGMLIDLFGTNVKVHVVNPGVIDTPLFHLPDNDPLIFPVEALPVSVMFDAVAAQLTSGAFEIYVPEWFGDITARKFPEVQAYLEGTAGYVAQYRAEHGL